MILARIAKAVREQNWFAVGIEFVIVIAGVVVGFQVTAWNEARHMRSQETDLLLRLHNDLVVLESGRSDTFDDWEEINRHLSAARPAVFGVVARDSLTDEECNALGDHAFIVPPPVDLPTLEELLAAGRIEVITDVAIRDAAGFYAQRRAYREGVESRHLALLHPLSEAFPTLVRARLIPEPTEATDPHDGFNRAFECDLGSMPANDGFLSMLTTNIVSVRAFVNSRALLDQDLDALHAALDARLDIAHETEAAE